MRTNKFVTTGILILSMLIISCAKHTMQRNIDSVQIPEPFVQKSNALFIILDASRSMADSYDGIKKLSIAKDAILGINESIPILPLKVAIKVIGMAQQPLADRIEMVFGPVVYSKQDVKYAISSIDWAGGQSPLNKALEELPEDIRSIEGNIAVLIVTDGDDMDNGQILDTVRKLKQHYQDRLSFNTIAIGNDAAGQGLLKQIAWVGKTGSKANAMNAEELKTNKKLTQFVTTMMLDSAPEQIANVPIIQPEPEQPEPQPSVKEPIMHEPQTKVLSGDTCFDSSKWTIKPAMFPYLDKIAELMNEDTSLLLDIFGHTDSSGSSELNQKLSERRANAVMAYLIKKGVSKNRMFAKGFGDSQPIKPNDTPEGRRLNRRVELNLFR